MDFCAMTRVNQINMCVDAYRFRKNIYNAMKSDDLSDAVMVLVDFFNRSGLEPAPHTEVKSEKQSDEYRIKGNKAYARNNYAEAIVLYNKALLFAPKNSKPMKLALSNRSAWLLKQKSFSACMKDIEMCFSMGCPDEIVEKLRKRKAECLNNMWMDDIYGLNLYPKCVQNHMKINEQRNPQIPCASNLVGVMMEDGMPKVVATKDIEVGTVVAIETSFVNESPITNRFYTCYYCRKMAFNLYPCDSCCFALFCGDDCRRQCAKEYHNVECQIPGLLSQIEPPAAMAFKAVIKMRQSCQTWEEFIEESKKMGFERIRASSINEIYSNKFSLLNFNDGKYFLYGKMYNFILSIADVIYQLPSIASFLPDNKQKREDVNRTLARVMMGLMIFYNLTQTLPITTNLLTETSEMFNLWNTGWFSFIGKLNHSCNPNLLMVDLNKEVALVAAKPIRRGTELLISKLSHWLEFCPIPPTRSQRLFMVHNLLCVCQICVEGIPDSTLNDAQKKCIQRLDLRKIRIEINSPIASVKHYKQICDALALFCDIPNSQEYIELFTLFRRCLVNFQQAITGNIVLINNL